jgi:hypothetical protein
MTFTATHTSCLFYCLSAPKSTSNRLFAMRFERPQKRGFLLKPVQFARHGQDALHAGIPRGDAEVQSSLLQQFDDAPTAFVSGKKTEKNT